MIRVVDSLANFSEMRIGDLVEFSATFQASPLQKMRKFLEVSPTFLESNRQKKLLELETFIAILEKSKPNELIKLGEEQIRLDQAQLNATRIALKAQRDQLKSGFDESKAMFEIFAASLVSGAADILVGDTLDGKYICKAYKKFAREQVFDDIFQAQWHVIGKIVGFVHNDQLYDSLKGSLLDIISTEERSSIFGDLSGDMNVNFDDTKITGPALVIATLGIFS